MYNLKEIKMMIGLKKRSLNKTINIFKEEFDKDHFTTLSWSDDIFKDSCLLHVYELLESQMTKDDFSMDNFKKFCLNKILTKSKNPAHSTSQCSNLMEEYKLAAFSEVYQFLQDNTK